MSTIKSTQIFMHKDKPYILQFSIEAVNFKRFAAPFFTDRYIDICSWEEIYSNIKKIINDISRYDPSNWSEKGGDFKIGDLHIICKVVDRAEGYINYDKLNYNEDWIITVEIRKTTVLRETSRQKVNHSATRDIKSIRKEEDIENTAIINIDEVDSQETKRQKLDPLSAIDNKSSLRNVNTRSRNINSLKQSSIDGFFGSDQNPIKQSFSSTKEVRVKGSKPSTSRANKTKMSPEHTAEMIKPEDIEKVNDFVARSEQQRENAEKRKEELKEYQILDCTDYPRSKLLYIVTQLKDQLISLSQSSSLPLDCRSLKFMEITTSNILTEKQILYICDSIQTMEDELNLNDNCLHEVLLPFVIIEIFKDKYKFTTEEAVQRIKVQEEKKILFNLNESY